MVFIGKNKAKLSRIFFLWPFFSVLSAFAPAAPANARIQSAISRRLRPRHPASQAKRCVAPMLLKNFRPQNFAAQVGESEFQRQTANATNLPQFWAFRVVIETLRSAEASPNFSFPKFSRRNLGRRRFQRQTLEAEGSNDKPRMKLPYHNFWPPASRVKRCVAPLFRENFRIQNFHGPSWRKQVPKTNRESDQLATLLGLPRCNRNAA